jgi:hypothetical protein
MENITPEQTGLSYDAKTIITILLLLLFYPVGIILMFVWMKWKWWVKLLVFFPVTFFFLGILGVAILSTINPKAQIDKANCVKQCEEIVVDQRSLCISECVNSKYEIK